jgi:hypothetical protein
VKLFRCAVVVALAVALSLGGCAPSETASTHPAAVAVRDLLALRSVNSTDVAAYEPFFAEPSLAEELAGNSQAAGEESTVPESDTPYVSRIESDTMSSFAGTRMRSRFRVGRARQYSHSSGPMAGG